MACVGMISHSRGLRGEDEAVEETGGKENVSRKWNYLV